MFAVIYQERKRKIKKLYSNIVNHRNLWRLCFDIASE